MTDKYNYKYNSIKNNMINKNILIFVFSLFLVMGLVSAEIRTLPTTQQFTCLDLPQLELNSTYQTLISVQYPNKTIEFINTNMTKNGYYYNYNYCNTNATGFYLVNGCSDLSCWSYDFQVTPNGLLFGIPTAILFSLLLIFASAALLAVMYQFFSAKTLTVKTIYFNILYLIALSIFFILWFVAVNFLFVIPFLGSLLYYSWFIMMILLFPEIIVSVAILLIGNIAVQKEQKLVGMGYSTDEARRFKSK